MPAPLVWTESLPVRTDDLTPAGVASVPALAAYLQEAAGPHAAALGVSMDELAEEGRAWVLARLRLRIERPPRRGDTVTVETWPSGLDGLYATREFVLTVGEAVAARATSDWFLIDTERRRPVRPPRAVRTIDPPDRTPALSPSNDDLTPPDNTDHERTVPVGYHDLDRNEHVNNVRFLTWALDTLPPAVFSAYRCAEVILQFRNEVGPDAAVHATAQTETTGEEMTARHALTHADTGEPLARVRTEWAAR